MIACGIFLDRLTLGVVDGDDIALAPHPNVTLLPVRDDADRPRVRIPVPFESGYWLVGFVD
jgi:hypothetical protein